MVKPTWNADGRARKKGEEKATALHKSIMERLDSQIASIDQTTISTNTRKEGARFSFHSAGTQYVKYNYPAGKLLDNINRAAWREHEDTMLIIEPDSFVIRKVRIPRYSARAILAKATRSADSRIFCTTIDWESGEARQQKEEYLQDLRYRQWIDAGKGSSAIEEDVI